MTPVLVLIFVQATTAVGTNLLYAATTKTAGTVVHQVTRRLAIGSIPTTIFTLTFSTSSGSGAVHRRRS